MERRGGGGGGKKKSAGQEGWEAGEIGKITQQLVIFWHSKKS